MTTYIKINADQSLTDQQLEMINNAMKKPIQYDEDLPKQTEEQMSQFKHISDFKHIQSCKQNINVALIS